VRAAALAENLQYAGVEVQWVQESFTAKSARALWADEASGRRHPPRARDWLARARRRRRAAAAHVPERRPWWTWHSRQPRRALSKRSLGGPASRVPARKYARNVRRGRHAPNEPYSFYDITSWALPPRTVCRPTR
jgi:hypothetical protein